MAAADRGKGVKAKVDAPAPTEPKETNSITFEWPLRGLKQMFDSSKSDTKSKVIKSASFGGGRWTVLFYAQSGHDQFCSLYLNAEPLPHERQNPLLACATPASEADRYRDPVHGNGLRGGSKGEGNVDDKWSRGGLFRFTFNIQTIEDKTVLGTKEAHDHAFSHRTSNWGWAQFAKRDHVYYKNSEVTRDDAFLITVTITASSEKPKAAEPPTHSVPPILVHAMGSLLDDPEHSDVVFHLVPSKRRGAIASTKLKKVYAIRKILSARSEYFRLMFESGFQEAELEDTSDDDDDLLTFDGASGSAHRSSPAHPHRAHHAAAQAKQRGRRLTQHIEPYLDEDSEMESDAQDVVFDDSDEEYDEADGAGAHSDLLSSSDLRNPTASGYNSPDGDGDDDMRSLDEHRASSQEEEEEDQKPVLRNGRAVDARRVSRKSRTLQDQEFFHPATADLEDGKAQSSSKALTSSAGDVNESRSPSPPQDQSTDTETQLRDASTKETSSVASSRSKRNRSLASRNGGRNARRRDTNADRRKRRKVTVMDSAYPTFKALLYFLYTDTIEFAPLTSSFLPPHVAADDGTESSPFSSSRSKSFGSSSAGSFTEEMHLAHRKRKAVIDAFQEKNPERPAPCSAKAMYRLADKLDIPDLKRRAQEHIALSLTTDNIVWEVFSGFNTQYPDIRKMETDFLLKHWPQVKRSSAMKSIFWRASAHPGLADVWPHLLEYLEYKQPDVSEASESGY